MLKKATALLLALLLLFSACPALSEERVPSDDTLYVTTDVIGAETVFRHYDESFYDVPCEQPGTVVKVNYTATVYESGPIKKVLYVYLPYGYDESRPYNIIYFTHGNEQHAEDLIDTAYYRNALDNMIARGVCEPFIMVFPTFYNNYRRKNGEDLERWPQEYLVDIMPLIESTYHTYAETADDAGFRASREHRAFNGYSLGSFITWGLMDQMLPYAKWFMPFAGSAVAFGAGPEEQAAFVADIIDRHPGEDFFIYAACGGPSDVAYPMVEQIALMIRDTERFSYGRDPGTDNLYFCLTEFAHSAIFCRFMLYNAFEVIFR